MFADEKKEIYAAEFLYRELGWYQKGKKIYKQSLPSFDKAVEISPKDVRALLGRSWARAKTTHYTCAIKDADQALKVDPNDMKALQLKALYLFLRTDFEEAMLINQRGMLKRKMPEMFAICAMECAEDIERTIGKRGGHALRDHYDIIRTIAWKKAIDLRMGKIWKPQFKKRKRKPKKTDITPPLYTKFMKKAKHELQKNLSELSILESLTDNSTNNYNILKKKKSEHQPPQARTTNIDNFMSEKYLMKTCYDKWWLRDLKNDPRIASPNLNGYLAIRTLARKGHRNVNFRQNILRVRQPFYSIKYNEVHPKGQVLKRQQAEMKKTQDVAKSNAETLIKLLRAAREAYLTNTCVELVNKAKDYIDKKPLKILPNKEVYLRQLYELIGLVHLDCYRLKENDPTWDPVKRINFLFGLPISREPSQDSVIQQNKKEFTSVRQAILKVEKRLEKATTPLETVWLFYDLARFNLDLKKYDLSRFYARKALNMAGVLDNHVWTTNVSMIITSAHVRQRNRNEAKNELIRTREFAGLLKNQDIIRFINACIDVVETIDFEDICIAKVIKQREQQIQKALLHKDTQQDIAVLFMKMNVIPASRRMSIMPGVRFDDGGASPKITSSSASIKPQSAAELEFQSQLPKKTGLELLDID